MPLDHDVVSRSGPQDRLLVFVHGYAEPPSLFVDRLDLIDPEGRYLVVTPSAPYEKDGRPIWHRAFTGETGEAPAQFHDSLTRLDRLVTRLAGEHGFDPARTVVAGFSQGAGLAIGLTVMASPAPPMAGCLAFCGFLPPVRGLRVDRARARGVPLHLPTASNDRFVPLTASRETARALADLGLLVDHHEADTGHTITDDTAADAGTWLDALDAGAPPVSVPDVGRGVMGDLVDDLWDWPAEP